MYVVKYLGLNSTLNLKMVAAHKFGLSGSCILHSQIIWETFVNHHSVSSIIMDAASSQLINS